MQRMDGNGNRRAVPSGRRGRRCSDRQEIQRDSLSHLIEGRNVSFKVRTAMMNVGSLRQKYPAFSPITQVNKSS